MARQVKVDGVIYSVPDNASMDQIGEYVKGKQAATQRFNDAKSSLVKEMEAAIPGSNITRNADGTTQLAEQGTVGTRVRESLIHLLEPFTASNVYEGAKQTLGAVGSLSPSNIISTLYDAAKVSNTPSEFIQNVQNHPNVQQVQQTVKGAVMAPVQPVIDIAQGISSGNYEQAAGGAGGFASQTVPAIEGAAGMFRRVTPASVTDATRRGAQNITGSSAFKTTEALADKFNEGTAAAAQRQAASDAAVAGKNVEATNEAIRKTRQAQAEAKAANEAAMNEADIKTERVSKSQQEADRRALQEHQKETDAVNAHNRNVQQVKQQAQTLDSNLREGSQQIGESIKDLNDKLKAEGDAKYAAVNEAVKADPGIPAGEMAAAAQKAKDLIKGSSENIKQIRELSQEADEGLSDIERLKEQGVSKQSIADMIEQGIIGTGENVKFDDIRGYSQEIGDKLAGGKGRLLPDVYQALKSLKESLDAAKAKIAERNNVGAQLKEADDFWHKKQTLMKDSESAIQQVRKRVGVLDPEYYAEPLTKGKATGVAVKNLRELPTQYTEQANAIADQAERLRQYYEQRKGLKIPTEKPLPAPPKLRVAGPRAMATLEPIPEPIKPKVTPQETITKPTAPTAQDVVNEKLSKVRTRAHNLGELHRASAFELLSLPTKQLVSNILKRPNIAEWIAQPTSADLAAASKLPPAEAAQLKAGLQKIIDQQAKAGKPLRVAPEVRQFMNATGATTIVGGVGSRREALKLMNRPGL